MDNENNVIKDENKIEKETAIEENVTKEKTDENSKNETIENIEEKENSKIEENNTQENELNSEKEEVNKEEKTFEPSLKVEFDAKNGRYAIKVKEIPNNIPLFSTSIGNTINYLDADKVKELRRPLTKTYLVAKYKLDPKDLSKVDYNLVTIMVLFDKKKNMKKLDAYIDALKEKYIDKSDINEYLDSKGLSISYDLRGLYTNKDIEQSTKREIMKFANLDNSVGVANVRKDFLTSILEKIDERKQESERRKIMALPEPSLDISEEENKQRKEFYNRLNVDIKEQETKSKDIDSKEQTVESKNIDTIDEKNIEIKPKEVKEEDNDEQDK